MVLFLKNLLFTFVVPGTVAVAVPLWIAPERSNGSAVSTGLALLALASGASVYAWCVWDFATFGRGTPAPIDAPKKLVVRGLYRVSRNPMYVGVLLVILGWALWFRAVPVAVYGVAVCTMFNLFIVLYEEPHLRGAFGDEYAAYCARVGRWLPRLRPGRSE